MTIYANSQVGVHDPIGLRINQLEEQVKLLTGYIDTIVRTQAEQNKFNQQVMWKLQLDRDAYDGEIILPGSRRHTDA